MPESNNWIQPILDFAYQNRLQSILVEGGSSLLQSFLQAECWDEIRVIKSAKAIALSNADGLKAPSLYLTKPYAIELIGDDSIQYFKRKEL